jgi:hypothetical protein
MVVALVNAPDAFEGKFAYQPLTEDGTIIARIASGQNGGSRR